MIQKLMQDHQLYMSEFQHDNLVTCRAGLTLYGQYKQSLREMYKRIRGLRESVLDRELLLVDISELQEKQEDNRYRNEYDRKRDAIELTRKQMLLEEANRVVNGTLREFNSFYRQAYALKAEIGELTPEKRDRLDRKMWREKILLMAHIDIETRGRIGENALAFALSLPEKEREYVFDVIKDARKLSIHIAKQTERAVAITKSLDGFQPLTLKEVRDEDIFYLPRD
jgi:hypothetical protein